MVPRRALPLALRQRSPRGADNETKIASHIARLMSHYWVTGEAAPLRKAQAIDWLDDLREFHEQIVEDSCRVWRRSETKRPTPMQIRALCLEITFPPDTPRSPQITVTTPEDEAKKLVLRQQIGERLGTLRKMIDGEIDWPKCG